VGKREKRRRRRRRKRRRRRGVSIYAWLGCVRSRDQARGGPQSKKPTIMEGGMGAKEVEADNRGLGGVRGKILGGMDGIVTAQKGGDEL
jgi:hypothetical protein